MKCHICSNEIENGFYLCKEHACDLYKLLLQRKGIIKNPDWKYHCQICGQFEGREIIDYQPIGYFCDIDIKEEWEKYNKS